MNKKKKILSEVWPKKNFMIKNSIQLKQPLILTIGMIKEIQDWVHKCHFSNVYYIPTHICSKG